jgi:hypothetical protein
LDALHSSFDVVSDHQSEYGRTAEWHFVGFEALDECRTRTRSVDRSTAEGVGSGRRSVPREPSDGRVLAPVTPDISHVAIWNPVVERPAAANDSLRTRRTPGQTIFHRTESIR